MEALVSEWELQPKSVSWIKMLAGMTQQSANPTTGLDSSPTTCGYPHPPIWMCPWSRAFNLQQPLKMCAELGSASSSPSQLFISYGGLKIMMVLIYVILHVSDLPHIHTKVWESSTGVKLCHNVLSSRHTTKLNNLQSMTSKNLDMCRPWVPVGLGRVFDNFTLRFGASVL